MQKCYIVGIELAVLLILFILMSLFWTIQKALLVIVPLSICTFECTLLILLSWMITKHFGQKFKEIRKIFLEEFDRTKEYYHGR